MKNISTLNQNEINTISGGKASDFIPSLETIAGFTTAVFLHHIPYNLAYKALTSLSSKYNLSVSLRSSIASSFGVLVSYELGKFLWTTLVNKIKY